MTFFETDEDMRNGHQALDEMSPGDDAGRRTSVEMYEVALDEDVSR